MDAWWDRRFLAADPATDPETLAGFACDVSTHVREAVAGNPSTPAEVIAGFVSDGEWTVRRCAAGNLRCDPVVLAEFANDNNWWVARKVGQHPMAPGAVLDYLARHWFWAVREAVASNRVASTRVLDALAVDPDQSVRFSAALNGNYRLRLRPVGGWVLLNVDGWDLADRLAGALRVADLSVKQAGLRLGRRNGEVRRWVLGESVPPGDVLVMWANMCGVDHGWLVGGGE